VRLTDIGPGRFPYPVVAFQKPYRKNSRPLATIPACVRSSSSGYARERIEAFITGLSLLVYLALGLGVIGTAPDFIA
jgi:hypothetical protein